MKYLYNEIELPALPEWDKTTYPYAYIKQEGVYSDGTPHYRLWCCTVQICFGFNSNYPNYYAYTADGTGMMYATYNTETQDNSAWNGESGPFACTASSTSPGSIVVWSNYDILNADGSVYLPASDPVPVETEDETDSTTPINADAYIVKGGKVYKVGKLYQARVGADPILQEKTVTENGEVTADEGYEGLSKVTVNVATYITVATEEEATDTATIPIVEGQVIVVTGA